MKEEKDHNSRKKQKQKQEKSVKNSRWIAFIFTVTVVISALFSLLSSIVFEHAGIIPAFLVLFLIVLIGILFDVIGVAVTAADIRPFHSMASHREIGAKEAIALLNSAEKVSSFCNDVVGDICGVVSGAASASLILMIVTRASFSGSLVDYLKVLMAALVSGLTVGGKAFGKTLAIQRSTEIVHLAGRVVYYTKVFPDFIAQKIRRKKTDRS